MSPDSRANVLAPDTPPHTRSLIPEVRAFPHPSSRGDRLGPASLGCGEWMGRGAEAQGCPPQPASREGRCTSL